MHFSIMAGCIPCLGPLLQAFTAPYTVEDTGARISSRKARRSSYYQKLDTIKGAQRNAVCSDDSANWRPFQGSIEGNAVANPAKLHTSTRVRVSQCLHGFSWQKNNESSSPLRDESLAGGSGCSDRLVIKKTTEVSIRYETVPIIQGMGMHHHNSEDSTATKPYRKDLGDVQE